MHQFQTIYAPPHNSRPSIPTATETHWRTWPNEVIFEFVLIKLPLDRTLL
jgi:hypothetical protein